MGACLVWHHRYDVSVISSCLALFDSILFFSMVDAADTEVDTEVEAEEEGEYHVY